MERLSKSVGQKHNMPKKLDEYDWASAALSLISSPATDLRKLVADAQLDPQSGDLSDVDLSDIDLTGQDLSGWDLRNANFKGAKLAGAELRRSIVDPFAIIEADGWEEAKLDDDARKAANTAALLMRRIDDL